MDYKNKLEELNNDEEFQSLMSNEQAYRMQYNTDMKKATRQGIEKGIVKGIEQGKKEMIMSMHENGITIPDIAKIAKLSEEEVKEILNNN